MGALADSLDLATQKMCEAAGIMIAAADMFPPCDAIGTIMGLAVGGPGTLLEGAEHWLQGAANLQGAQQELTSLCDGLSSASWSGGDRELFDTTVRQLAAQLGDAHNLAEATGAVIGGMSGPLLAYGPVCLDAGITMLAEAIAFEAAVGSVVGNLGASEAIYAEACAVGAIFLGVIAGFVGGIATLMDAGAAGLAIGEVVDVRAQARNGDTSATSDFKKAQVQGLGEVAQNLEGFAVGVTAGAAGGAATKELPTATIADRAVQSIASGQLSDAISNTNQGAVDVVTGKDPLSVLTDTLGITPQVNIGKDAVDTAEEVPADLDEIINKGVKWGTK